MIVNMDVTKLNTQLRRDKAQVCASEMQMVLSSLDFAHIFLRIVQSAIDTGKFASGELSDYRYMDKASDILDILRDGAEVLNGVKNKTVDIVIDDYHTWKGVIGYTYPSKPTIYVNRRFFDVRPTVLCGSNLLHEWGHKMGFKHSFRKTKYRRYSLCYLLNDIYEMSYEQVYPERVVVNKYRKKPTIWQLIKRAVLFWI